MKSQYISQLKTLIDRFKSIEDEISNSSSSYNETEVRNDFINEFLKILGWDVTNTRGLPRPLREVIFEANVGVEEETKKPDYEFRLNGIRKFFVEAKKPSVNIFQSREASFQTRRYGWSAKLPISVLTNFKQLTIYDCLSIPNEKDSSNTGIIKQYTYDQYVDKFDEIYSQLSKESVTSGQFSKIFSIPTESRKGKRLFDDYFLEQIEKWRILLANDIFKNNPKISEEELNYLIQVFINRIVFLRICEDRNLETYGSLLNLKPSSATDELLKLFKKADQKYDSGLFDFIRDKLSPSIVLSNETLVKIVKDLYYPLSPYTFSVIDSKILGDIYEHFIAKIIIINKKGKIELETKPEVKIANGVFTTPSFVVKQIIEKTVIEHVDTDNLKKLDDITIADIACGSGVFLLEAYKTLLNLYLSVYIKNNDQKHLRKNDSGDLLLRLDERKRILTNHIFGVDIDEHAVEVAKFSLSLRLIEDIPAGEIDFYLSKGEKILPTLEQNIKCGNSLIGDEYFKFRGIKSVVSEELHQIKPFDWKKEFPSIFNEQKGFSVIVGNPPYTKIQNIIHYSPNESEFYKSTLSPFLSSKSNNFDKYQLFIERALTLLKNGGVLGFITPHKFATIKAGEPIRGLISTNKYLKELTHFGTLQIFGNKSTTYSCIIVLQKSPSDSFEFEQVDDLSEWEKNPKLNVVLYRSDALTNNPWVIVSKQDRELFDSIEQTAQKKLGDEDIAEIFVGLQTSADDIYIVEPTALDSTTIAFSDRQGKKWEIERAIGRSAILDQRIHFFKPLNPNKIIIFPYVEIKGKNIIMPEELLRKNYPQAYSYLNSCKERLAKRDISNSSAWYQYGRSQSLDKFNLPKAVIKNPSLFGCAVYDNHKIMFTGGGNGPYYGIRPTGNVSIFGILALINNSLFDKWVKARSSVFRGGYYSYGKQFISKFPLPLIESPSQKKLINEASEMWKEIIMLNEQLASTPQTKQENLRKKSFLKKQADEAIFKMYGIDPKKLKDEEVEENE